MNLQKLEAVMIDRKDELQKLQRELQLAEIAAHELIGKIMHKTIEVEDAEIAYEIARHEA